MYAENIRFFYSLPKLEPIFEENFDSYTNLYTNDDLVNAGWKVVNGSGNLEVAWRLWNTGGEPMVLASPDLEGMTENYMITNSDFSVEAEIDEELTTPEIDCRGWEKVRLHLNKNYRIYDDPSHLQIAEVDMRVFDEVAGTWGEWINLLHLDSTLVPLWTDPAIDSDPEQADLSGYADGKRIQLRWHFYEVVWDYWFAIDDVLVSGVPVGPPSHPGPVMRDDDLANGTKNITLRSKDPSAPTVVANTIIEAREYGPVVTFLGAEDESCLLAGFTIRNGDAHEGGGICGGTSDTDTHATMRNNVIAGNSAGYYGGGLAYCSGVIENNVISNNRSGFSGGGLAGCQGLIRNNTITDNSCGNCGGGLYACDAAIQNNIISRNSSGTDGGGLSDCHGPIVNNTICDNEADLTGGGLYRCSGSIRNCIVWGNVASVRGHQLFDSSEPTYSCIQNWHGAGEGNISAHPYFLDSEHGDYHLKSYSPCIDAGDPSSDFSQEPQPKGGRINMGAYGNTPEAASASPDSDRDGLRDEWETLFFGGLEHGASEDSDGDGWSNLDEYIHGTDPASFKRWYVDGAVGSSGDGTSWETAFNKVQQGIDAASDGDIVLVAEGVYTEKIRFPGKNITVSSTDPGDPTVVANTILDGGLAGAVVTFWGLEGEFCVLSGFTIRHGRAENGGGIHGRGARATICNNVITANCAMENGGGLYLCEGMIHSNTIAGNSAGDYGGGLAFCGGGIESNIIWNNWATDDGGGLYFCGGVIRNTTIADNSAGDHGGGLGSCGGVIENNVIVNNSAPEGGGLCGCSGMIRNCIMWGNTASGQGPQLLYCSKPSYSCIQNWREGGVGNLSAYPHFVDPDAGDFRLQSWSPCIDAGDPSSDFSNEPPPNGGRIDIGAYGNTRQATSASPDIDEDLLPDDWEMLFFGHLRQGQSGDADGNGWSNLQEYLHGTDPTSFRTWYVDASVAVPGDGTSWQTAFQRIRHGFNAASDGDMVIVAEGTYRENIHFQGKSITLTSTNPSDPAVVANTILDGESNGSVVTFSGGESEACLVAGFTIRNGRANRGGGIAGNGTYATVRNNTITENEASEDGAGVHGCDGTLRDNTITGNRSTLGGGGGLANCGGVVQNNLISANKAYWDGGGFRGCGAAIKDNVISGNWARKKGGGLALCGGTIRNNLITGNSSGDDGGGLAQCDGTIQNNIVTTNSAQDYGGGLFWCKGIIKNNLISHNSAKNGGGLSYCPGTLANNTVTFNSADGVGAGFYACGRTIFNCILHGNAGPVGAQLYECSPPTYSCIQDWTGGGEGNIAEDPQFVDAENGDFRLLPSSPCVDAGENYLSAHFDTDAAGTHRTMFGGKSFTVDMGAYEYIFNDLKPGPSVDETTLTWSSLPYTTYSIFYSHDLLTWHLACEFPSSDIETTSWIDDGTKTGLPPSLVPRRFYRVLENL